MNWKIVFAMTIRECKPWFSQIFQDSFASQPKYSVRVILELQQPASGILSVNWQHFLSMNCY
jgi:hypothetical protein